jgi:hypothetical protein
MKNTSKQSESSRAASAKRSMKSSNHQQQRITLSMIEADLESLMTDLQSLYAKVTTKVCGIIRK